jgi:ribosomal protein S6
MTDKKMPAVEVGSETDEQELARYELAFHILPTVAEGEVAAVFQGLKDIITTNGGTVTIEEAPSRFDLAYEIIKYLEGRNRKFTSAYFGWVRFEIDPSKMEDIAESVDGTKELLRHLLTRLTKLEEAYPFYFHEALEDDAKAEDIEINAEAEVAAKEDDAKVKKEDDATEKKEVTEDKA